LIRLLVLVFLLVGCRESKNYDFENSKSLFFKKPGVSDFESNKMKLYWRQSGEYIDFRIVAPTEGWLSIGFHPTKKMLGANIIMLRVTQEGVEAFDHYGNGELTHKEDSLLGGANDVKVLGGSQKDGESSVSFQLPIEAQDKTDTSFVKGAKTDIIMAYGPNDEFESYHGIERFKASIELF
jgi:hypothetical protein